MRVTGDVSVEFGVDVDIAKDATSVSMATKAVRRWNWSCIVLR